MPLIILTQPNASYNSQIDLEGETFTLRFKWNETDASWALNIIGVTTDTNVKGIKLVSGPNLLKPYALIELGGLYVLDVEGYQSDPDFDGFGDRYILYYVELADVGQTIETV